MNLFEAVVLGLIQGLTEFLPVSSSGHLELGKYFFGIDAEANFYFSVAVHGATVLSTVVVLYSEIQNLVKGFFRFRLNEETKYILKIVVSMIPVAASGFFMQEIAGTFFTGNMINLGFEFIFTALLLGLTFFIRPKERPVGFIDSFIIGIAQVIAVLPGVSRSGATIATGMMIGNRKEDVAKFSFLMVLVPIIGANFVEMISGDITGGVTTFGIIAAGFTTAFISGYFACKWMISLVKRGNLLWFALYCFLLGLFTILTGLNVF